MRALTMLTAAACMIAAGCNHHSSAGAEKPVVGAVAVIDLDAIAQRLGSDKAIVQSISEKQSSLSQQLVQLAKSYNEQIAERQKALPEPTAEETKLTLANWQQQANQSLNKVKQQAELDLQRHRANLIAQFREEIKPAARRVAQARGLSVIVTRNDSVLYDYSPAANITDAVIAELLAARTAAKPLPAMK